MDKALIPFSGGQFPEARRGLLARIFAPLDVRFQDEADRLRAEHALLSLSVELSADLQRKKRQANHYLEVTALEDRAAKEVAKVLRCREACENIEDIFPDDPIVAELLKIRVRKIFNGHNGAHPGHGRGKR
jgi:hypothetical protein